MGALSNSAGATAAEYSCVAMATNGGRVMASIEQDTNPNKEDEMLVGSPDRISGERNGFVGDHSMGFMLVKDVWRASGLYGVEETC